MKRPQQVIICSTWTVRTYCCSSGGTRYFTLLWGANLGSVSRPTNDRTEPRADGGEAGETVGRGSCCHITISTDPTSTQVFYIHLPPPKLNCAFIHHPVIIVLTKRACSFTDLTLLAMSDRIPLIVRAPVSRYPYSCLRVKARLC